MARGKWVIVLVVLVVSGALAGGAPAGAAEHPWWDLSPGQADQQFELGRADCRTSKVAGRYGIPYYRDPLGLRSFDAGLLDLYDAAKLVDVSLHAPLYELRWRGFLHEQMRSYTSGNGQSDTGAIVRRVLAEEKDRVRFFVELHGEHSSYDLRRFRFTMETDGGVVVPMRAAPLETSLEKPADRYISVARYSPEFPRRDAAGRPYLTSSTKWVGLRITSPAGRQVRVIWTLSHPPSVRVGGAAKPDSSIW
ncbi:MAG TPA: hypothetical protein VMY87_02210 [Armatimonadota bacterium]|nr:hypothetical protein [Armatimonadota bacterium]